MKEEKKIKKIALIGLGYVGLPLAAEFSKKYFTVGFDINENRVNEINNFYDSTLELPKKLLESILISETSSDLDSGLKVTSVKEEIKDCNVYVVTVPTPIDQFNQPNLRPLLKATELVANYLKVGDYVIYESTVYPGTTEEECIPILEKNSGLVVNQDFFVGYSPERINPGDKHHTVSKILKVTSGSNPEAAEKIDRLYKTVIEAGTYKAPSLKVAEAAKVIENSQRDLNIAFINELAKIFNLMDIDTQEVLEVAKTKWNFLSFNPGLVGGHCIGVDPYYLARKAQILGYHPEILLAGRRMNDSMGTYVSSRVIKLMLKKNILVNNSQILLLGITFKENCPDVRNTKVVDIYNELNSYGAEVTIYDPWADSRSVRKELKLDIIDNEDDLKGLKFDALVLSVAHEEFKMMDFSTYLKEVHVIYDVKSVLDKNVVDERL